MIRCYRNGGIVGGTFTTRWAAKNGVFGAGGEEGAAQSPDNPSTVDEGLAAVAEIAAGPRGVQRSQGRHQCRAVTSTAPEVAAPPLSFPEEDWPTNPAAEVSLRIEKPVLQRPEVPANRNPFRSPSNIEKARPNSSSTPKGR